MSNYTITTDFGAKDSLPSSNSAKVVRGSEFTTEFTNIQTAIATKADIAGSSNISVDRGSSSVNLTLTGANPEIILNDSTNTNTCSIQNVDGSMHYRADEDNEFGNSRHRFYTDGTQRMEIEANGNVGIGTDSPDSKLDVSGVIKAGDGTATDGGTALSVRYVTGHTLNNFGAMYSSADTLIGYAVESHKTQANKFISTASNSNFARGALTVDNELKFFSAGAQTTAVGSEVTMTERMRIDSSGNVGIGTTSPQSDGNTTNLEVSSAYGARILVNNTDTSGRKYGFYADNSGNFGLSDYTAVVTRMLVDSSGNVGIGTTNPASTVHIQAPANALQLNNANEDTYMKVCGDRAQFGYRASDGFAIVQGAGSKGIAFGVNNATFGSGEAMRIESNGNVMVGTTADVTSTNAGVQLRADNTMRIAKADGAAQSLYRLNSNGDIINFYKGGSSVGSIGSRANTAVYIDSKGTTGTAGLDIDFSIAPRKDGALSDGQIDLGTGSYRFQDLHLSGGVYVGGTAAANKLDDYEEGTWTPVLEDISGNTTTWAGNVQGFYTKIGNTVNAWYLFSSSDTAITNRAYTIIRGLPFSQSIGERASVATISRVYGLTMSDSNYYSGVNGTAIDFLELDSGNDRVTFTPTGVQQRFTGGVTYRTS